MKKVCIAKYLYVLIMVLVFTVSTAFSQVKAIHFNAGWNEANDVEWFNKLSDVNKKTLRKLENFCTFRSQKVKNPSKIVRTSLCKFTCKVYT